MELLNVYLGNEARPHACFFLYQLLAEREPHQNISHREMPTYENHCEFVNGFPYFRWYIVTLDKEWIGSVYLTNHDEIGIQLRKDVQGKGIGAEAVKLLIANCPCDRYLANISPRNTDSIKFFMKLGFKEIQVTYELRGEK